MMCNGLFMGSAGSFLSLRSLLSSRVVASTVVETVGSEMVSDNGGLGYFVRQCVHCGAYDIVSYVGLMAFVLYLQYGRNNMEVARISEIDGDIMRLRQVTVRILWIVLLVFAKNVENAV